MRFSQHFMWCFKLIRKSFGPNFRQPVLSQCSFAIPPENTRFLEVIEIEHWLETDLCRNILEKLRIGEWWLLS